MLTFFSRVHCAARYSYKTQLQIWYATVAFAYLDAHCQKAKQCKSWESHHHLFRYVVGIIVREATKFNHLVVEQCVSRSIVHLACARSARDLCWVHWGVLLISWSVKWCCPAIRRRNSIMTSGCVFGMFRLGLLGCHCASTAEIN